MALTYTEIEEQKNARIVIFFAVVLLFYFIVAVILGNITKVFFTTQISGHQGVSPFLTPRQVMHVLMFALIAAILHTVYSVSNAMSFIQNSLQVEGIDPSDRYHSLFNTIVDEVNVAAGGKYKIAPVVIPTVAMNAFAISDRRKNAVIGVTEGLLSKLNRQQLQAVVAHEVAHVASGDSFQTTVGCALFGVYAAMLNGIRRVLRGSGRARVSGKGTGVIVLFLLVVYAVLSVMQFFYILIRMLLSRNRELRADAIAVRLTRDPISLSEALYAISRGWAGMGYIDENLESIFIVNPVKSALDEREDLLSDLLSTHPPIEKRMSILADMAHVDVKGIESDVIAREKLMDQAREITGGDSALKRWLVMDDAKRSSLECPRCRQQLVEEEYEGALIERCVFCEGVLLGQDTLPRIIIRREKAFGERIKKMAELSQKNGLERMRNDVKTDTSSLIKCPKCSLTMARSYYTLVYLVEVDKCSRCNVLWLDKDELEMVQYLIENKKGGQMRT